VKLRCTSFFVLRSSFDGSIAIKKRLAYHLVSLRFGDRVVRLAVVLDLFCGAICDFSLFDNQTCASDGV
jgi:hypothetical protein